MIYLYLTIMLIGFKLGIGFALVIKTVTEIFTNMFSIRYLAIAAFHIYNLDTISVEQE